MLGDAAARAAGMAVPRQGRAAYGNRGLTAVGGGQGKANFGALELARMAGPGVLGPGDEGAQGTFNPVQMHPHGLGCFLG